MSDKLCRYCSKNIENTRPNCKYCCPTCRVYACLTRKKVKEYFGVGYFQIVDSGLLPFSFVDKYISTLKKPRLKGKKLVVSDPTTMAFVYKLKNGKGVEITLSFRFVKVTQGKLKLKGFV